MSESSNPLANFYGWGDEDAVVAEMPPRYQADDVTAVTLEQARSSGLGEFATYLLRDAWGKSYHPIHRYETLGMGDCIAGELGFPNEWPECHRPASALVNGWSAGPTPLCRYHLGAVTKMQGDTGIRWVRVKVTLEQLEVLAERDNIYDPWSM